jgi:hypothetical protein
MGGLGQSHPSGVLMKRIRRSFGFVDLDTLMASDDFDQRSRSPALRIPNTKEGTSSLGGEQQGRREPQEGRHEQQGRREQQGRHEQQERREQQAGYLAEGEPGSKGGTSSIGGTSSKGGTSSMGGTSSKGGESSKGGTSSMGGTSSKGGTSGKGGFPSALIQRVIPPRLIPPRVGHQGPHGGEGYGYSYGKGYTAGYGNGYNAGYRNGYRNGYNFLAGNGNWWSTEASYRQRRNDKGRDVNDCGSPHGQVPVRVMLSRPAGSNRTIMVPRALMRSGPGLSGSRSPPAKPLRPMSASPLKHRVI